MQYEEIQKWCLTISNNCRVWLRSKLLSAECTFLPPTPPPPLPPCEYILIIAGQDGCCSCTMSSLYKRTSKQSLSSLRGSILHLLNIFRKSLSSPLSLWDRQQPKLLSDISGLEPCSSCFVDIPQALLRKARLTSLQWGLSRQMRRSTHVLKGLHVCPSEIKIML